MSGQKSYLAGVAAENIVERIYLTRGAETRARRWRGARGELDLVMENDGRVIFVEVKHSRSFRVAAERFVPAQRRRVYATSIEYLTQTRPDWNGNAQFDVALVNGVGDVEILENALVA